MNRRQFVAAAAVPIGVGTAGCSLSSGSTVALTDPEIETQQGGREKYLIYRHNGDDLNAVGFHQRSTPKSLNDRFKFQITVSYSERTRVESFRFDLHASESPTDPPADIHLTSPDESWTGLTYGDVGSERRWTRIALPDAGEIGDSTIYIDTVIEPRRAPAERIDIRTGMELASRETQTTYEFEESATFEPTTEPIDEAATE